MHYVHELLLFNTHCCYSGFTGFIIWPEDTTVAVGQQSTFLCLHSHEVVSWRINGQSPQGNTTHLPSYSVVNGSTIINFTMLAREEYNRTSVECITKLSNESRQAIFNIQGNLKNTLQ